MKYILADKYVLQIMRQDNSVSKVAGYGLDDQGLNFPPHHNVQTGSGDHHASYIMGTRGSFSRAKTVRA
jgi:hypothetical protein